MNTRLEKFYKEEVVPKLTQQFGYTNPMQVPRLVKITLNMGVSEAVSARASHRVRLPMAGKAESLNAAVAAGIMIYDLARAMGRLEEGC